jgi:hypothetical protein
MTQGITLIFMDGRERDTPNKIKNINYQSKVCFTCRLLEKCINRCVN